MKITRFTQSCLLIEEGSSRILFDASAKDAGEDFGKLDAVIYTHQHADHFDPELAAKFVKQKTPVHTNASTAKLINGKVSVVADGDDLDIGSIKLKAMELPHCLMVDGSAGPQNTGYLINDKIFNPGDGKELAGLSVENLITPIQGPDISFKDAFDFAEQVSAKTIIPVHYDGMGAKPEVMSFFKENFKMPFEIKIIAHGESLEL